MTANDWEKALSCRGLSMNAGATPRIVYVPQLELEEWLSAEGSRVPDLMDIVEYRHDHMEAA